ncbi:MAG: VanZ family protein [Actinomycetota bacterium]|nr:VanZ family protein [Actinomycetota bacterium]
MHPTAPSRLRVPWLAIAAVIAVVVVVTLLIWPTKVDGSLVTLVQAIYTRFDTGAWSETIQLARFIANIALFVPLAFLVALASRRWWLGLVVGVATSAGSELVQRILPGRVPSIEDLIANSLGAAIGTLFALAVLSSRRTRKTTNRRL